MSIFNRVADDWSSSAARVLHGTRVDSPDRRSATECMPKFRLWLSQSFLRPARDPTAIGLATALLPKGRRFCARGAKLAGSGSTATTAETPARRNATDVAP